MTVPAQVSRKPLVYVTLAQCFGLLAEQLFSNGLLFMFLSRINMPNQYILYVTNFPSIFRFIAILPCAYLADRMGKKTVGYIGLTATIIGFGVAILGSFLTAPLSYWMIALGLAVYVVGHTAFSSSWFAILYNIIPEDRRGRFVGTFRVFISGAMLLFNFVAVKYLKGSDSMVVYTGVFLFCLFGLVMRLVFYRQIPDPEHAVRETSSILEGLKYLMTCRSYMQFNLYTFLMGLPTLGVVGLFVFRDIIHFSASDIVLIANLGILGSLAGNYIGGRFVDRFGNVKLIITNHFMAILLTFALPLRFFIHFPLLYFYCATAFVGGLMVAAVGVALSKESFDIMPNKYRSLAVSLTDMSNRISVSIAVLIAGQLLSKPMLAKTWTWGPYTLTNYDTQILMGSVLLMLLTSSLILVPCIGAKLGVHSKD